MAALEFMRLIFELFKTISCMGVVVGCVLRQKEIQFARVAENFKTRLYNLFDELDRW